MKIIKDTFKACFALLLTLIIFSPTVMAELVTIPDTSEFNTNYEPAAVQRLYNKVSGEHLLTTEQNEINELTKGDWNNEGVSFYAPGVVTKVEVKRFYNPKIGIHLYSSDQNEWNYLKTWGWNDEGVAFYGATSLVHPIYRLFTPQLQNAPYFCTSSDNEYNKLPTVDPNGNWRQEGIGWYADTLSTVDKYTLTTQRLDLPSVVNIRQLGGYEMSDGRKVKDNMLIRSAALDKLSDADKAKLEAMNLKAIFDFRSETSAEAGSHPDIVPEGATYYSLPAIDGTGIYDQETMEAINKILINPNANLGVDIMIMMAEHYGLDQMYTKFMQQDMAKQAYRKMFNTLLENAQSDNPGAVLWHCTQGKDRAGVASALILTALGADDATVLRDYSLTTRNYNNEIKQAQDLAKI